MSPASHGNSPHTRLPHVWQECTTACFFDCMIDDSKALDNTHHLAGIRQIITTFMIFTNSFTQMAHTDI